VRSLLAREPARTLYLGGHTLARMQPRQLAGVCERTARELVVPALPVDFDRRYERRLPASLSTETDALVDDTATLRRCLGADERARHRNGARAAAEGAPVFLNRSVQVGRGEAIDWTGGRLEALPEQWRLKLYGFQPVAGALYGFDPEAMPASVRRGLDGWIRAWVESVAVGGRRYLRGAWTPWSVSLRVQRWLRYLAWHDRYGTDAGVRRTLRRETYKNALFLRNHVEWDIGGNHLVENGVALLAAGVAFGERDWALTGTSVLETVAREQFLEDGCHFERSPMYHVVVLSRLLTAVNLLRGAGRSVPESLVETAGEATRFLRYLRPPDGEIPLLNDAVHGETLSLDACLRYADLVGVGGPPTTPADPPPSEGASGYRWLRTDAGAMLVDGGPVGPPHLPGHSHSDTLGVLLWVDGSQVVTDTGTFGYAGGPRRDYARGVRSHNTVQVGGAEPVPLGGQYLLGPRPQPSARFHAGDVSLFEGRYRARPLATAPYTHHRAVYAGDDWWVVDDAVAGDVDGPLRSRLHLHPDVDVGVDGGGLRLAVGGRTVRVRPLGAAHLETAESPYFPRFGEALERSVAVARADAPGAGRVGLAVTVGDTVDVALDRAAGDGGRLRVGDREHRLPACRLEPGE